jgi:hypothetical protein
MRHLSFLAHGDDANLLGKKHKYHKSTEILLQASMEAGLEVNTEETMFSCLITRVQDSHSVLNPLKM